MKRREFSWHSPNLGEPMRVGAWGWFGKPVILYATATADHLDYERFKVIDVLAPLIEAGRIKVYTCEGAAGRAWLDADVPPGHKAWRQHCFDRYVAEELAPFISNDCGGVRGLIGAGASLGAMNAVNTACKHPELFDLVIGMSGTYEFDRWMSGYRDMTYYFNQPLSYVPNLPESPQLDRLRQVQFVLATGQGRAEAPAETERMAAVLASRGVPARCEVWGHDVHHDWPTWRTMLPLFLDRLV